jgi:hypothetical protein
MVYFLLEQFDPSDLTDTRTHYDTSPIALSCSSHNLLSRGEHNVPGHFIMVKKGDFFKSGYVVVFFLQLFSETLQFFPLYREFGSFICRS